MVEIHIAPTHMYITPRLRGSTLRRLHMMHVPEPTITETTGASSLIQYKNWNTTEFKSLNSFLNNLTLQVDRKKKLHKSFPRCRLSLLLPPQELPQNYL